MKYLFAIIAVVLVAASIGLYASMPDVTAEVPVIYWVTDPNPAREEQVRLFHEWLVENGHTTEDGRPLCELRLDTGNRDTRKQMIQGVSGVGSDVMDLMSRQVPFFQELGILADVSDHAQRMNFGPDQTYEAIKPELVFEGGQWAFPCNVSATMHWVNKETFERYGQPIPPRRMTIEEFEQRGKAFVEAANIPGEPQKVFFASTVNLKKLYRSMGLSMFNETLTRCSLDDPRFARALSLIHKWTFEDDILPSASEAASFDTQAGYGGTQLQLFNEGNYGIVHTGRYALIQLRRFGSMDLAVIEPPHAGYPNIVVGARAATVYVDGQVDYSALFLSYLASETYNTQIVRDADALPPNPAYTDSEAYKRPPDYPGEWGLHEVFSESARTIGHASVHSPYVLYSVAEREQRTAQDYYMNQADFSAEDAGRRASERINAAIARNVADRPELQAMYEEAVERQARIDELKARGEPIPADLIDNHFLKSYYADQGMLADPARAGAR